MYNLYTYVIDDSNDNYNNNHNRINSVCCYDYIHI